MASATEDEETKKSSPSRENTNLKDEASLLQPLERLTPTCAQQHDNQTAVLFSSNHDGEILNSKAERTSLIEGHKAAIQALFNASAEDLNTSYQPGTTETAR